MIFFQPKPKTHLEPREDGFFRYRIFRVKNPYGQKKKTQATALL